MTIAPWRTVRRGPRTTRHRSLTPTDLLEVAEGFAHSAGSWPGLDDPRGRCWRTIAATDRFEAWVVAWPVGDTIELHDHGESGGVVVLVSGSLLETSVRPGDDGSLTATERRLHTGGHVVFGPGHVHDLVNDGSAPALSVHVYSPVLRTMTFYDHSDTHGLTAVRTEEYRDGMLVG